MKSEKPEFWYENNLFLLFKLILTFPLELFLGK